MLELVEGAAKHGRAGLADSEVTPPGESGDTTPCRTTGVTLHSHVRYKEILHSHVRYKEI